MTIAVGLLLGAGLVLALSPWLWPVMRRHDPHRTGPLEGIRTRLRQAGLGRVPVGVFIVVSVLLGVVVLAVASVVVPVLAIAVVAGIVAALLPFAALGGRARARQRLLRAAWPDLVDHLVSGLRSGLPLAESVGGLAMVGAPETREAFRLFEREVQATGAVSPALDALKERLCDPVADRIVETLRMAREVGGTELPSVLRNLAASLRADLAVRAEAEARQSWVLNAARLGVVAPWLVLVLLASRPEAASAYNSPLGMLVLGIGVVVTVIAYRLMVALGRLPDERRWFA
ncbi:type II secretion system F family protein [Lysinimonas soli]|uniref:Type II secretion system F family protein n=1 Tax=Lysinimonas soli TaxID=1074233 RepID=A0ABW0NKH1_9MICO